MRISSVRFTHGLFHLDVCSHLSSGPVVDPLSETMLAIFEAHASFVTATRPTMSASEWQALSHTHGDQIIASCAKLPRSSLTLADATSVVTAVQCSIFDDATKGKILRSVNALAASIGELATGIVHSKERTAIRPQDHFYMEAYLTEDDWGILQSGTARVDDKLEVLLNRARAIGLTSLSEKTSVALTCLLILAHNKPVDNAGAYALLQSVKDAFKKARSRSVVPQTLQTFPPSPNDFVTLYPDTYTDQKFVPSRVDSAKLLHMREMMPARKTHSTLRPSSLVNFGQQPVQPMSWAQLSQDLQRLALLQSAQTKQGPNIIFAEDPETPQPRLPRWSSASSLTTSPQMRNPPALPLP